MLPYAPDSAYGRPEDLKALVQAAHRSGLMVFLDVVYNHFGPKGKYLPRYAPQFFTDRHQTPWGAAIDFAGREVGAPVLRAATRSTGCAEYRFDGLRFDAVHAIIDDSSRHVLDEMRAVTGNSIRKKASRAGERCEPGAILGAASYTAQWNDDSHHGYHVLATGERDGYYVAYADAPAKHLARCLAEGFAYQGEISPVRPKKRGEPSAHLSPAQFVDFLQNHDQVGNRASASGCWCSQPNKSSCA